MSWNEGVLESLRTYPTLSPSNILVSDFSSFVPFIIDYGEEG